MPAPRDFRGLAFDQVRIERCGKYLGRHSYWKLYEIENVLRVILHSVLSKQIHPQWWDAAVDRPVREKARRIRDDYIRNPQHTAPGGHDIYYVFLPDISNIMRANSHLLAQVIQGIDTWITRIGNVRLPRNLVGHMNYPNLPDRKRINDLHEDIGKLIQEVEKFGIEIRIP